jgi:hypothetical protein
MKYALTCLAGPTAMGLVALAPDTASRHVITMGAAGRTRVRRGRRGGPGFGIYVGPRHRYGGYAYLHRPYYYGRYSYAYGPRWRYRHRYWD